jgi:transposase
MNEVKYIGADVHSASSFLVVLKNSGDVWDQRRLPTTEKDLAVYIESIPGRKKITFEETNLSRWLYQVFKPLVDEVVVCNPSKNTFTNNGPKTDGQDAMHLARLLKAGYLTPVYHGDDPRERFRDMVSAYGDLVQDIVRLKNRYRALFRGDGNPLGKGQKVYKMKELQKELKSGEKAFIAKGAYERLQTLLSQKEDFFAEMKLRSKPFKEVKILRTLPGIDHVHAWQIVAYVVTPHRFASKYKFWSYCGLVKHRQISDGKVYGNKKAHGNNALKDVFRKAGKAAIRGSSGVKAYYEHLISKRGFGEREAYNAVCREIAALVRSLWKKGEKYNDEQYRKSKNLSHPS